MSLIEALRARYRKAVAGARDAGASALEFAIIAAIVVVAASVIGGIVYNIVSDKSEQLDRCASQPIGSEGCDTGGTGG